MGKLSSLSSPLSQLPPAVGYGRDAHGHSRAAEPWRKWYSTAAWARLKAAAHERDGFTCQCGCGTLIQAARERIADHIRPHRGDRVLFFDPANVQTLWKPCHDSRKQAEERKHGRP